VLWQNGAITDIGSLGGVAWNTPAAINHKGQIAGFPTCRVTGVVHRISTLSSGPKAVVSRTSARFQATLSAWPSVVGQSIDATDSPGLSSGKTA